MLTSAFLVCVFPSFFSLHTPLPPVWCTVGWGPSESPVIPNNCSEYCSERDAKGTLATGQLTVGLHVISGERFGARSGTVPSSYTSWLKVGLWSLQNQRTSDTLDERKVPVLARRGERWSTAGCLKGQWSKWALPLVTYRLSLFIRVLWWWQMAQRPTQMSLTCRCFISLYCRLRLYLQISFFASQCISEIKPKKFITCLFSVLNLVTVEMKFFIFVVLNVLQ